MKYLIALLVLFPISVYAGCYGAPGCSTVGDEVEQDCTTTTEEVCNTENVESCDTIYHEATYKTEKQCGWDHFHWKCKNVQVIDEEAWEEDVCEINPVVTCEDVDTETCVDVPTEPVSPATPAVVSQVRKHDGGCDKPSDIKDFRTFGGNQLKWHTNSKADKIDVSAYQADHWTDVFKIRTDDDGMIDVSALPDATYYKIRGMNKCNLGNWTKKIKF